MRSARRVVVHGVRGNGGAPPILHAAELDVSGGGARQPSQEPSGCLQPGQRRAPALSPLQFFQQGARPTAADLQALMEDFRAGKSDHGSPTGQSERFGFCVLCMPKACCLWVKGVLPRCPTGAGRGASLHSG